MKQFKIKNPVVAALLLAVPIIAHAGMSSSNFSITTSVVSGGGSAAMSSSNYSTDATLGQSTPLMDPSDMPYSANYDLYPGFWHTVTVAKACVLVGDINNDGRINLLDFGLFKKVYGTSDSSGDFNDDGKVNLLDFGIFKSHYGESCD